jgi:histidyl-tRNA synthetase
MLSREALIETARRVYRSYGFAPIDTPALELAEILIGKGGDETDRQLYRFRDAGDRDVALRFDLTVPLARFVSQHANDLGMPFKRYHIATVWRGESPQEGRYREFMQCDFDTIGSTSIATDIETALVIHDLMRAIGFDRFTIRLNNRKLLNGLLAQADLAHHAAPILRAIDKLAKIGPAGVAEEIRRTTPAGEPQVDQLLNLIATPPGRSSVLDRMERLASGNELGRAGTSELRQVLEAVEAAGADPDRFVIDVSIARGLDYYTGTIYETLLDDLPAIGSVCSGGRYDNLAKLFSSQELPGVGASLGLDRMLAAMEKLGKLPAAQTPAQVLIVQFDPQRLGDYLRLAAQIRAAGLGVEVYPDAKKLGAQFKYADRKGFRAAIVAGTDEWNRGIVQIKRLSDGRQSEITTSNGAAAVIRALREMLDEAGVGSAASG